MGDLSKYANGGFVVKTSSGRQKRGDNENLDMPSKFPDGYFEWVDRQTKNRRPATTIDFESTKKIDKMSSEMKKMSSELASLKREVKSLTSVLNDILKLANSGGDDGK